MSNYNNSYIYSSVGCVIDGNLESIFLRQNFNAVAFRRDIVLVS